MKPGQLRGGEHARRKHVEGSKFPIGSLPPPIAAIVRAIAEVHGVPEVMPAAIALSMIAAAIGKGLRIASGKGRHTMANLYVLVSAESGTCKSTTLGILMEPFEIIQNYLNEFAGGHGSAPPKTTPPPEADAGFDGSVGLLPPPGNEVVPERRAEECGTRLTCSNVTGSSLAKLLAENRETTFNVNPEAGNLLKEASKLASPLGELLLKGYSGDPVEIDRSNRKPVVLAKPCITVCWLCQPHRLDQFLASDYLMEAGLLARFLVAHSKAGMALMGDEEVAIPVGVSDSYGAVINTVFENYGQRSGEPLTVLTSHEAFGIVREYHNRNVGRWDAEEGSLRLLHRPLDRTDVENHAAAACRHALGELPPGRRGAGNRRTGRCAARVVC